MPINSIFHRIKRNQQFIRRWTRLRLFSYPVLICRIATAADRIGCVQCSWSQVSDCSDYLRPPSDPIQMSVANPTPSPPLPYPIPGFNQVPPPLQPRPLLAFFWCVFPPLVMKRLVSLMQIYGIPLLDTIAKSFQYILYAHMISVSYIIYFHAVIGIRFSSVVSCGM